MPAACREPLRQNIRYSADDVTPLTLRASASANELLVVASAKQAGGEGARRGYRERSEEGRTRVASVTKGERQWVEETREQKLRGKLRKKSQKQRNLFSDPRQKVNRYILVAQEGPEISKSPRSLCTTLRVYEKRPHNEVGNSTSAVGRDSNVRTSADRSHRTSNRTLGARFIREVIYGT
jgi:hypothetical protein